jgi:hypothetical protein
MSSVDAKELGQFEMFPRHDKEFRFDRIDVSNITDEGYLGIFETLRIFLPLLKTSRENPNATLLTNFVGALKLDLLEKIWPPL